MNYQSHVLRTYYDVRQRFTKLERHYPTVETIMQEFYDIIKLPFALKCWINIWKLAMATYPMMRLCSQEKTKTVNSLKRLLSFNTLLSCQPQNSWH